MTLADDLQAKKPIVLRQYAPYSRGSGAHQFVGSLMVPKQLEDGRYPVVDVWTRAMNEVVITPFKTEPKKLPRLFIGAAELSHKWMLHGNHVLLIDSQRGVEPQGYGFGFALYAAAALAAKFAGPDGIFSFSDTRSPEAAQLWERMKKLPLGSMLRPFVVTERTKHYDYDFILGQSVLDSGLVVRLGQKHGKQWADFRAPPTRNFALDLKFKAKPLESWQKAAAVQYA